MSRYSVWQNDAQLSAAGGLSAAERDADRGAFFGSISATLNHLLWGDRMWLSRFGGCETPAGGIPESPELTKDWSAFEALRQKTDHELKDWARGLTDTALVGDIKWHSGALGRDVIKPLALCVTHMFNHGTHHRGQIHAMLTAAGANPTDTDLFIMPEETQ